MTTKEAIHAAIENIREEDLHEPYRVIRRFAEARASLPREPGVLSKLKQVKIRAPEDFATNLDLYLSGEKQLAVDQDLH